MGFAVLSAPGRLAPSHLGHKMDAPQTQAVTKSSAIEKSRLERSVCKVFTSTRGKREEGREREEIQERQGT